jgi:hypothetical protein
MRYVIEFIQQGQPYFAFPISGNGAPHDLARNIMKMYFPEGSDNPRPVPPSLEIPNEVRIVDDAGHIVGRWSLVEEFNRRRAEVGENAKVVPAM